MTQVRSHRDLLVWQKAMDLVVLVYKLSEQVPPQRNVSANGTGNTGGGVGSREHR